MDHAASSRNVSGRTPSGSEEAADFIAAPSPGDFTDGVSPRPSGGLFGGEPVAPAPVDRYVCPYCGLVGTRPDGPCSRCTIEDSPQTRQATKARIGPWYVLQARNPAAPGMKWSTLLALVKKGQVTPRSVVRGPTTHQLWRLASQVRGLSREFGLCYSCGLDIPRATNQCPHCDRLQEPPPNPDVLLEPSPGTAAGASGRALGDPSAPRTAAVGASTQLASTRSPARDDAGLLSARELATAFQLDFRDPGSPTAPVVARPGAGRAVAGNGASVLVEPASHPPRRRRLRRAALVLLLLAGTGAGAMLWFTPEYRAQAVAWYEQGRNWGMAKWRQWQQSTAATTDAAPPVQSHATAEVVDRPEAPSSASATVREPPVAVKTVEPADAPKPKPTQPPPPTAAAVDESLAPDERARLLRRSAIDAEAAGDYRRAVQLYEQIRKLPREFWPSDLQLRLDAARARVN